jgi:hypothetical protein
MKANMVKTRSSIKKVLLLRMNISHNTLTLKKAQDFSDADCWNYLAR